MKLRRPMRVLITVMCVAWTFDFLFWRKSLGISFALYIGALLIAALWLSYSEHTSPSRRSLWLFIPIGITSLMTTIRLEPLTRFVSMLVTLGLLILVAYTFRSGNWVAFGLSDYFVIPFKTLNSVLTGAPQVYKAAQGGMGNPDSISRKSVSSLLPITRGLFLALPVVIVLGALLASADPIFSSRIEGFLSIFSLERLFEYIVRAGFIFIIAYVLAGIYLYALTKSQEGKLIGIDKPAMRPFLGAVEAWIILVCVNLLFITFVLIQFQYFFGGGSNISIDGLTYAQYARRGFGELVLVVFFSFLLFLALSSLARRETPLQRRVFSGLGVLLGLSVGVILISAFQRLTLYEEAFGFTRLRTYPHIFMVWLGIVLAAFISLELVGRSRAFGLVLMLAGLGFALTLGVLNVDRLILEKNLARAQRGAELDLDYLLTLSVDSTQALADLYNSGHLDSELRDQAGAVLACQAAELRRQAATQTWTGFHFSTWRAQRVLDQMQTELSGYQIIERHDDFAVVLAGVEHLCEGRWVLE